VGDLSDEDRKENDYSLEHGFRLLSAYRTHAGDKLWIITESDRSVTTMQNLQAISREHWLGCRVGGGEGPTVPSAPRVLLALATFFFASGYLPRVMALKKKFIRK
jgi:hypothetical protein